MGKDYCAKTKKQGGKMSLLTCEDCEKRTKQKIKQLKQELAEANEKLKEKDKEMQDMDFNCKNGTCKELNDSIPKSKVQKLRDVLKVEMDLALKANTDNGREKWQAMFMIDTQLKKLLSDEGEK